MSTIALQEKLAEDFNTHQIVVDKLYALVQKNGTLKIKFTQQMDKLHKDIKRLEKLANNTMSNGGKCTDKNKNKDITPP